MPTYPIDYPHYSSWAYLEHTNYPSIATFEVESDAGRDRIPVIQMSPAQHSMTDVESRRLALESAFGETVITVFSYTRPWEPDE